MSGDNANFIDKKIGTYFPIFTWVWGGCVAVMVAGSAFMYNMKIESVELKKELQAEQKTNAEQEKKINETHAFMQQILSEQTRIAQSLENMSKNVSDAMVRVARDTSEIRARVDRHIENGHNGD